MKKLFIIFAIVAIFSVQGCIGNGDSRRTPELNNTDDADETADNTESDSNDQNTGEDSDHESNDPDLEPNNNDDETPEYPDTDLPECSLISPTPCRDSSTGLIWSAKYRGNFSDTLDYCLYLEEGGFEDWDIPGIQQLRTLIQNCSGTEVGGSCEIEMDLTSPFASDPNVSFNYSINNCYSCDFDQSGKYSKFGDTETFWTFSFPPKTLNLLTTDFAYGSITESDCAPFSGTIIACNTQRSVRCTTGCSKGYFWYKNKCIKSQCTSESCDIPHSDPEWCVPETETTYRCGCESNYVWTGTECVSPCENVTCDMPNSDGICKTQNAATYKCGCVEGYFWNEEEKTCETPCDENPC